MHIHNQIKSALLFTYKKWYNKQNIERGLNNDIQTYCDRYGWYFIDFS